MPVSQRTQVQDSIHKARLWLLKSGIQEPDGGVARYVRTDTGKNAGTSTEITAYFLSSLLFSKHGDSQQACRAAEYLCEAAWNADQQLLLFQKSSTRHPSASYFFDCGIAGLTLLEINRVAQATAIAKSMARDFLTPTGFFAAALTLPSKAPSPPDDWWSRRPGCYQLKAALLWLRILEHKSEPSLLGLYEKVLAQALPDSESFLAVDDEHIMDRLHAYLYFLEGLLPVAANFPAEISEGIARVAACLDFAGSGLVRSDVIAQLLRLRLLEGDPAGLDDYVSRLLTFQIDAHDPRWNGAFAFGTQAGEILPYANPVSTIFAMQALSLWLDRQDGLPSRDWRVLI